MLIIFYNILYEKHINNDIKTDYIEQFDFIEYNTLRIIKYYKLALFIEELFS